MNIARWLPQQRSDGMTAQYLREWEKILGAGLDRIVDALAATDEKSCELRENFPFAGVLSQERRTKVLQTLRTHRTTAAAKVGAAPTLLLAAMSPSSVRGAPRSGGLEGQAI